MERGEQDQKKTLRRESISGHQECSCAECRRTNHEAITADIDPDILFKANLPICLGGTSAC